MVPSQQWHNDFLRLHYEYREVADVDSLLH